MSISEQENTLFKEWSNKRDHFVTDGVVSEEDYKTSQIKLCFVLKEVNDPGPDGGGWDLREFIRDGARPQTWDNLTRWIIGIRGIDSDIKWSELENIEESDRKQTLLSICAMNLKKITWYSYR